MPAGHVVAVWDPATQYVPATQDTVPDAVEEPAAQVFPAGQVKHTLLAVAPVVVEYVPAAHAIAAVMAMVGQ